jgi:hypothetical protein
VLVKGPGVIHRIHDAQFMDAAPASIVFNLRQQKAADPASRFRPNHIEPSRPRLPVRSEDSESLDVTFFIYGDVVAPALFKIIIEMAAVIHNIFHVLENSVFH